MNRIEYALGVLDKVCKKFDEKHKGKVPYFLIHVIPVENAHWRAVRERYKQRGIVDVKTGESYDDFKGINVKKTYIKTYVEEKEKQKVDELPKTNKINGDNANEEKWVRPKNKGRYRVGKDRITEEREVITWNYYDVLAPIYGEVHEIDDAPTEDVVKITLEKNKFVEKIKFSKIYPKNYMEQTNEVTFLGLAKDKEFSRETLDELTLLVGTQNLTPKPFVFRSGDSSIIKQDESKQITMDQHHIEMFHLGSQIRAAITRSLYLQGLEVVISKKNDVEIIGEARAIKDTIEKLKHILKVDQLDSDDEVSDDEFSVNSSDR